MSWREERALLMALIDQVPDYLFVKDTHSRFLLANSAVAKDIGRSDPATIIGETDFDHQRPEVAEKFRADDRAVMQSGQPRLDIEEYVIDASGSQKWLSTSKVPLRNENGEVIGVIGVARDVTARKEAEEQVRYLAHHDALTGLANRNSFYSQIDAAIDAQRTGARHLALLLIDLDRFKEVNDLFGHAAGDALLQMVARCVSGALDAGKGQAMARLGGDEFAILAPDLDDPAEACRLAERVLEAVDARNHAVATDTPIALSIGVATFPRDALDRASLLNHADTALYRAKSEGKGAYRRFEVSMGLELRERLQVENDLRHAIERRELALVYQPQYCIGRREPFGFEALLRWRHPIKGEVPPSVFIPLAEQNDLILRIGEWVLRAACREAASWPRPLTIAVNISAVQLRLPNFAQLVHEVLLTSGLAPSRLELEITESALIQDPNRALNALRRLRAIGVRIAMDDFGTGHSSLANLRAFPFDKIKIDRSFVKSVNSNEQAATIVRAVVGLGKGLGLPVLAEGVETAAELAFLDNEACGQAQGYFLARPHPIAAFRAATHGEAMAESEVA